MKQLFPIEIQESTVQNHWTKRHTKSKIIYLVIIITLLIVCISLPFIYVDVSSQSRGTIRTPHENNSLQSAINGEIVEIQMYENKSVVKGDTLIRLKTDEQDEQIVRLIQRQEENNQFIMDINTLLIGGNNMTTPKYQTENAQYMAKISEHNVSINQAKKEYFVSKSLYEKGVESKFDYDQTESRFRAEESQLSLFKQQQKATWQAEKTRLEYENRDLLSQLQQIEKRKTQYVITAPITGNIIQFTGLKEGNFISAGQTIAQISSGDSLIVECLVMPNDIGYIHLGQEIQLQMDAYNYQQWGLLSGKVVEIISDVVQIENQVFFRVRCSLNKTFLELPSGYKGNLKKGMTATTRFFLTRRSLAQLLFDKIDNWMNPKIITDGNKN